MRMMDAIVKPSAAPGLELRQVPVPTPGPGEVLIKIHKTAICGTDVHIYDWNELVQPSTSSRRWLSDMSTWARSQN